MTDSTNAAKARAEAIFRKVAVQAPLAINLTTPGRSV
jgi:hypothetical protein